MSKVIVVGSCLTLAGLAGVLLAWEKLTSESGHLSVQTQNLSFELAAYHNMADTLQGALGDPTALIHFPDMATVNSTFSQMQNGDDLKALINAFGVRDRDLFGIPFVTLWEGNLVQWLIQCLETSELQPIRAKFNQYNVPF